jgi:ABC-2 type transport system ATP-binding protein
MDLLRIDHLSKSFGPHKVIDDLSFAVPEHSIFGFVGQNGAGKTTTMKMVLGLLKPDSGTIMVNGEEVRFGQNRTNQYLGYLPDVPEFYGFMKPREYLKLCGEITGLANERIKSRSDELLSMVGLERANKKIGGFSRGMKQRLGIAQALLNEPKLLICDEPTSALDPIGCKEILDILQQVKGKTTVVFSTHILSDVERICDQIAVIHQGRITLAGTLTELKAQHKQDQLLIEFTSPEDKARFMAIPQISAFLDGAELSGMGIIMQDKDALKMASIVLDTLAHHQIVPTRFELLEPSIENLFLEAVK